MASDIMIDIETLAVSPDATILTIGAQGFDPFSDRYTEDTFYKRITLESQPNRKVDDSTVEWWGKQGEAAMEEALGDGDDRVTLKKALEELTPLLWKSTRIWANGVTFDMVILENAFNEHGLNMPWQYWQVMDARTIYKMIGSRARLGNSHNALEDCVNQIDMLQKCLKDLNIREFG